MVPKGCNTRLIRTKQSNAGGPERVYVRQLISFLKKGLNGAKPFLVVLIMTGLFAFPAPKAEAGIFSFLGDLFAKKDQAPKEEQINSQTVALLSPVPSPNPNFGKGGGDITIADGTALLPDIGPSGTASDAEEVTGSADQISAYTVRKGDTLAEVAKMFNVTSQTIMWANDLTSKSLKEGQELTILPVSGVRYTVKRGDTIAGIAKKYGGDAQEIQDFNDLSPSTLIAGRIIMIPGGELPVSTPSTPRVSTGLASSGTTAAPSGYFVRPLSGGHKTQGIHGYNGVDIGAPTGTPVYASAGGEVVISKYSAGNPWFGGYGNYVVIRHSNGTQTLYAHLSSNFVSVGERVAQGQTIGAVGNTGRSTGSHLHFEVRGARNPF
ncbi:MAG: hypothetical protein A2408_02975 [Candidatus Yonathbacteria bacterium RIFOXYC1_FULL_52_10]|uniref:LysM domain-containing protein n=1 Tax=Candidatus Yonathbacteria bacterium RIFOXYD1_FULL_52_36 TaxID=1802730 RepID=A0A1G2SIS2_9BACT|nr:MAG: hypothetical protein A2408_02975 [Candidatus Yonathbacteria bacterium RIFOXYC1_FULL_52_10]OHA84642.1 MAG: hypothetical protein A2591_02870 [Candidatus Yonathbacteria bacterium RIFOXYD1_FULL_52_36]